MNPTKLFVIVAFALLAFGVTLSMPVAPALAAADKTAPQRLLIDTSGANHAAVRADLQAAGNQVVIDLPEINLLVVYGKGADAAQKLAQDRRIAGVAHDGIRHLINPARKEEFFGKTPDGQRTRIQVTNPTVGTKPKKPAAVTPDTAFNLPGLMWDYARIKAQKAWNHVTGVLGGSSQIIKVGVADTGLDYTHVELQSKVDSVVDFTLTEQPNICSYFFGFPTDQQLATTFSAPSSDLDFNGHGSWIGGNIAGNMHWWNPTTPYSGTNGIAPAVQLVSLKISQNCGSAYDSEIIDAFAYAANHGIDIVSISFGGYLDRSDPDQDLVYRFYERVVNYAWRKGTLIVAAAGNEHVKLGDGGQVISHGDLSTNAGGGDLFGLYETPGGIPKVVMVSATGNVVNAPSASCPSDSLGAGNHQWCKPTSDAHQPFGVGKMNQLTYYSNYGPRIDFAAPGGARKFNLPVWDRGGTEGWPWTGTDSVSGGTSVADGYNAWETYSITSNWATEIPCFTFTDDPNFVDNQCYAIIQGTSMATPHVSAAAADVLAAHPEAWKNPAKLYALLQAGARKIKGNTTPPVSKKDTSAGDLSGVACPAGWCHLGGAPISDADAYGNGLINVFRSAK
jgi:subtilisin family serine protease